MTTLSVRTRTRAERRWMRLFEQRVLMESGFHWTESNAHLTPQKAMSRWVGKQSKNFQIRYAEVLRRLRIAETLLDNAVFSGTTEDE